jgi:hypothetical protein
MHCSCPWLPDSESQCWFHQQAAGKLLSIGKEQWDDPRNHTKQGRTGRLLRACFVWISGSYKFFSRPAWHLLALFQQAAGQSESQR